MPRISQLTELDVASPSDILVLVDQSTGQTKRVSVQDLFGIPDPGWQAAGAVSYNSAGKINVTSELAAKLNVGSKFMYTQTTVKKAYVTDITGTVVTINGGTDFVLANAAITDAFFSNEENPSGFPDAFNYAGTPSSNVLINVGSTGVAKYWFSMKGRKVFVEGHFTAGGSGIDFGAGGNPITVPLPVAVSSVAHARYRSFSTLGSGHTDDAGNSTWPLQIGYQDQTKALGSVANSSSDNRLVQWTNTKPFGLGSTDSAKWQFQYDC